MNTVRNYLRENPGRWLWAAAAFALAALLPEYLLPVMCLIAYCRTLRPGRKLRELRFSSFSRTEQTAFVLTVWIVIGSVYTGSHITALVTLFLWCFFMFGSFMMQRTVDRADRLEALFFCGSLGAGVTGGIGILQMVLFHYGAKIAKPLKTMFNPFWHLLDTQMAKLAVALWPKKSLSLLPRTQFIAIRSRASATFTNPIYFAVFLCMMLPLCAWGVFYSRSRRKRLFSLLCLALDLGGIACSYSRGPYLAVGVVFVILLFYGRKYAFRIACAGGVMLCGAAVAMRGVFKRLLTLLNTEDISVSTHADIWRACFRMLRGHWLFGYGTGVGNVRNMLHNTYHICQPHAHNIILEMTLENGVIGSGLFIAMLVLLAVQLIRLARRGDVQRGVAVTLLASMAAFCACGMSDYLFYGMKIICYFWMVIGLALSAVRIYASENGAGDDPLPSTHETVPAGETL